MNECVEISNCLFFFINGLRYLSYSLFTLKESNPNKLWARVTSNYIICLCYKWSLGVLQIIIIQVHCKDWKYGWYVCE